jgi:bla regulator protein blaR1
MNTWIYALGWTLVDFVWQGAVLGCATAALLALMRNARAEHRYLVACTALMLCFAWPAWELSVRLGQPVDVITAIDMSGRHFSYSLSGSAVLDFFNTHLAMVVGLWAACAAALAMRLAAGLLWIGRVVHDEKAHPQWQAHAAQLARQFGIGRTVHVRVLAQLASPVTIGWLRPAILLPASLVTGMPPHLLEALIAHEMAHVRRFDYLVNLGQNVIEMLLFYHPTVWWISRRIRVERELIADELAAQQTGDPRTLALALSELEKMQFSGLGLAVGANDGDLVSRIRRLVQPDTQTINWKAAIPVAGLVAACFALQANAAREVKLADVPPVAQFASCAKPKWPAQSLANEDTGTVTLGFLISKTGEVADSRVNRSSGHAALDEAARAGIKHCKFKPGTRAGQAVETWMQMQYVWTLE